MTKTILAILAAASIAFGICAAAPIHRALAMGQAPQETWVRPAPPQPKAQPQVHKQPKMAHKDHLQPTLHAVPTRPVEPREPVVAPEVRHAPQAAPEPPKARRETFLERNHREVQWVGKILGFLLIGGALMVLFRAGQTVYAGYNATHKGTISQ